jgi:ABC-type uncharacterized transport system permease subunit
MSMLLRGTDKADVISLIYTICRKLLYPNLQMSSQKAVERHLTKLLTAPVGMDTKITFETIPELQVTRIIIETVLQAPESPK